MKRATKREFSKSVLMAVMFTYFAGVILGGFIVYKDSHQLGAYLGYIGAPTSVALGFYSWKAKNENMAKICQESKEGDDTWR